MGSTLGADGGSKATPIHTPQFTLGEERKPIKAGRGGPRRHKIRGQIPGLVPQSETPHAVAHQRRPMTRREHWAAIAGVIGWIVAIAGFLALAGCAQTAV
jgi:hypothetical protein